jgi:hypothetical protein
MQPLKLGEWYERIDNHVAVTPFAEDITTELEQCLVSSSSKPLLACCHLVQRLKPSSLSFKEDLIWCLLDMLGEEESYDCLADWLNSIDRGGLWLTKETTYMLSYVMEQVVQRHPRHDAACALLEGLKASL